MMKKVSQPWKQRWSRKLKRLLRSKGCLDALCVVVFLTGVDRQIASVRKRVLIEKTKLESRKSKHKDV